MTSAELVHSNALEQSSLVKPDLSYNAKKLIWLAAAAVDFLLSAVIIRLATWALQ